MTKISPRTILNRRGFTLVEIMIVLAILAGLLAIGIPRIRKDDGNIKKVLREMAVLGKEIRNQSRLKNMTHRLVIQMGSESTYWVESAAGPVPAKSIKDLDALSSDEKKAAMERSPFKKSIKFFNGKVKKLPSALIFKTVETLNNPEPSADGVSYIYFTPEGLIEKSIIQIGNKENKTGAMTWSLIYNPLTGHADLVDKAVSLKDVQAQ